MKVVRIVAVALAALAPLLALAQVPPHRPGEICVTPKSWCWQKPPGKPGTACTCLTPFGPTAGQLQ